MLPIRKGAIALALSCASLNAVQPSLAAKGPMFGKFCYWLVKGVGYGAPATIATTTLGSAATTLLPEAIGASTNIAVTGFTGSETAALMTASQWSTAVGTTAAGFEGLPVVGFIGEAMTALPAGATATALTAAQTAQLAQATTAALYAPGLVANTVVSTAAASAMPAASIPAATGGIAVGKAIIATIGIEAAGAAVAAVTTAAEGVTAYTVMVEGAALTAGALGTACPWLP